jgi:hypothetical protein
MSKHLREVRTAAAVTLAAYRSSGSADPWAERLALMLGQLLAELGSQDEP